MLGVIARLVEKDKPDFPILENDDTCCKKLYLDI
jgi:hypothetical protein